MQPGVPASFVPANAPTDPFVPILLKPFCILLDWLTVNMRGPWRSMPRADVPQFWKVEDITLLYHTQQRGTEHHDRRDFITDGHGQRLATILSEPRGIHAKNPQWIQVTFDSCTLQDGSWSGIFWALRAMGCEHVSVSRMDIAADGLQGSGGDFLRVINAAEKGHGRYYGKAEWSTDHKRGNVSDASFGKRASDKYLRCYNKSKEMKQKGVKQHIVNAWIAARGGEVLPRGVDVERLEVQLRDKELDRYIPNARDPSFLATMTQQAKRRDVFASTVVGIPGRLGIFDFRTHAERARNARPLAVWDFSDCGTEWDLRLATRQERMYAINDHSIKMACGHLYKTALALSLPELMATAELTARAGGDGMAEWYFGKVKVWQAEHRALMQANDPRTIAYFRNLRDMDAGRELRNAEAIIRDMGEREHGG